MDKLTWHDKERDRYWNYLKEHWTAEKGRKVAQICSYHYPRSVAEIVETQERPETCTCTVIESGIKTFLVKGCNQ